MICLLLKTGLYTTFIRNGAPRLQLNQWSQRPQLAFLETCTHCCLSLKSISNLIHATKNKDCTTNWIDMAKTGPWNWIMTQCLHLPKLTENQLKPSKGRYCQSERRVSATYGILGHSNSHLRKWLSPIFLKRKGNLGDLITLSLWNALWLTGTILQIFSSLLHRDCTESLNDELNMRLKIKE